jgi:hypothetical protein
LPFCNGTRASFSSFLQAGGIRNEIPGGCPAVFLEHLVKPLYFFPGFTPPSLYEEGKKAEQRQSFCNLFVSFFKMCYDRDSFQKEGAGHENELQHKKNKPQ